MQKIWVVDAFSKEAFKGNPAGVCIVNEWPEQEYMQNVSAELGFSNSAFAKKIDDNHYSIKWFTPKSEAPLCGHATIATTHILIEEGLVDSKQKIVYESQAGMLECSNINGWYALNFPIYNDVKSAELPDKFLDIVKKKPIYYGRSSNFLFMEFAPKDLKALKPDLELLKEVDVRALIATSAGENEFDFMSRYFAPKVGINEDPVCASAHCRLIPYWTHKLAKTEMLAFQASERTGIIKCKNLGNRVLICGEAVTVFKGDIIHNELRNLKNVA